MPVLQKISSYYPSFNEAERKVADTILRDPESSRALTITRLGELSGVSQTTVNRFCRVLGFEGYSRFKLALVEDLVPQLQRVQAPRAGTAASQTNKDVVQNVMSIGVEAIVDTMENLDMAAFDAAVSKIARARTVATFGVGSSLPVAMDLHYRLLNAGAQARFSEDSHIQAISASLLTSSDVAIAISYSGETRDTLDVVDLANEAGAATVCLTHFPKSTLAQASSICITTSGKKSFWLNEAIPVRLAQLAICDALCIAIGIKLKRTVSKSTALIARAVELKRRS